MKELLRVDVTVGLDTIPSVAAAIDADAWGTCLPRRRRALNDEAVQLTEKLGELLEGARLEAAGGGKRE
jgi:hypothetical protein